MEPLAHQNPDVDEYQVRLAEIQLYIGQIEYHQEHMEAAIAAPGATPRRRCGDCWPITPRTPATSTPSSEFSATWGIASRRRPAGANAENAGGTATPHHGDGEPKAAPVGVDRLLRLIHDAITNVRLHSST